MRRALFTLVLALTFAVGAALGACGGEGQEGVAPVAAERGLGAPEAVEPSPFLVEPHLRRSESAGQGRATPRPSAAGGGGGSRPTEDPLRRDLRAPAPSQAEVERFRSRLDEEMQDEPRVDGDDGCVEFFARMAAMGRALGQRGENAPDVPSRAEARERCANVPAALRRCLAAENITSDECQRDLERFGQRSERRAQRDRARIDDTERDRALRALGVRRFDDEADEEEELDDSLE